MSDETQDTNSIQPSKEPEQPPSGTDSAPSETEQQTSTEGEATTVAASRPQDAPPPSDAAGQVVQLRPEQPAPRAWQPQEFANFIEKTLLERGATVGTVSHYKQHAVHFIAWAQSHGIDLKTMPPDTAVKFLDEVHTNPIVKRGVQNALRSCFEIALVKDFPISPQTIPPPQAVPKRNRADRDAEAGRQEAERFSRQPPKPDYDIFSDAGRQVSPAAARPAAAPSPEQPAERRDPVQPARSQSSARRSAVPSLGGRIRITKRVDGSEGLSLPIGSTVLVGNYTMEDLEGTGTVADFVADQIRPVYGPFKGQRPTVYYVDRLDNLGNPIPGSTMQVPVMPHAVYDRPQAAAPVQAQPQPQTGVTGDKFFDYVIAEQRRRDDEWERRVAEIRAQAEHRGADPMLFALLIDRARPPPLDIPKLAEEFRRTNRGRGRSRDEDDDLDALLDRLPSTPSRAARGDAFALDGGLGQPPAGPSFTDALVAMAKESNALVRELLAANSAKAPPEPREQLTVRDVIDIARQLQPPPPPPPPPDPLRDSVMTAAVARLTAEPPKAKSLTDIFEELKLLFQAKDMFLGDRDIGAGDIAMAVLENAQQIGRGVGEVLSGLRTMKEAPQVGGAPGANGKAAGANGKLRGTGTGAVQSDPRPQLVLPDAAKEAFLRLRAVTAATDTQAVVNDVFTLLKTFDDAGGPLQLAAKKLIERYKAADTRHEVQGVAVDLFLWPRAKGAMTKANVERITDVLHENYSALYKAFTGEEKTLSDAPQPQAEAEAEAASGCTCDASSIAPDPACPLHGEPTVDERREEYVREQPAAAQ